MPGEGNDKIVSSVSLDLNVGDMVNVENLTLAGSASLNGTGNARSNTIFGNDASNVLTGLDGSDQLLGHGGNDVLAGGTGNDLINGGAGNDSITTGTGHDRVVFDAAFGADNIDAVQDFNPSLDTFLLHSAIFTALTPGALAAGALVIGTAAADGDDRIIYDSSTGLLSYDADGAGGAAQTEFAVLPGSLPLTNSDFVVI
jgi:Ca2+-binding RTX toxin-like protein